MELILRILEQGSLALVALQVPVIARRNIERMAWMGCILRVLAALGSILTWALPTWIFPCD